MNLYTITEELATLLAAIAEQDGEITEEQGAALIISNEQFDAKIGNYAAAVKNYEADASAYAEEIKRLQARKKTAENIVTRLKTAMLGAMVATDRTKVKAETFTIGTRRTKVVVVPDDPTTLPSVYQRVKVEADKAALKAAIESGETIEGVELQENTSVTIK